MTDKIWSNGVGKLCPDLIRQRTSIEFITDLDMSNFSTMESYLSLFLKELSDNLGMKIFLGPLIGNDENTVVKESGPSAFVGWTTSGCMVHLWPFRKFGSVDIYSCKIYDLEDVITLVEKYFNPKKGVILGGKT
jgi:S-adenosylmethionine/arginine decarboxylase-like enzyme